MTRRWICLAVLATGCGRTSTPPLPPLGGRLAFTVDGAQGLDREIWLLEKGELRALTAGGGTNEAPAWTPEGRLLMFSRNVDGLKAIYTWEEVKGLERYGSTPFVDMAPSWSPDGRRMAYM